MGAATIHRIRQRKTGDSYRQGDRIHQRKTIYFREENNKVTENDNTNYS